DEVVVELRHRKAVAVEDLVLQEDDRVGIADCRLEQALGVGGGVRRDHLETWNVRVPGGEVLAVLSRHPRGRTVRATKNHRRSDLAPRPLPRLSVTYDHLIHGLHVTL